MSMTFTKLFSSITESTIWVEPYATRIVWVSMLAMADRKGRIWASVPGLARRAGVTLEECEVALHRFKSPDKYSRTPDNEGRRIADIDGGWQLLNYEKYRSIRDEEARREYQREWDRANRNPTHSDKSDQIRPPPTQAEAEAEAEADKSKPNCTVPLARDGGRKAACKTEAREYLEFLNAKAGKHFRPVPSNLRFIEARLAEGVTLQDLKTLTVRKCREWLGTDQEKFLRPETLCNATKCHSYLGAIPPEASPCSAPNAAATSPETLPPAPVASSSPSDSSAAGQQRIRGMASALGRALAVEGASTLDR